MATDLTHLRFNAADHGRRITVEEAEFAEYEEGHKYEIIDGRITVSPIANFPEHILERWLRRKLESYSDEHLDVMNLVVNKSRVFVPEQPELTVPEPDLACYHDFPLDAPFNEVRWKDVSPLIVAEILVDSDSDKDMVRNVDLYFQVPSIVEYWILDGSNNPNAPTLIARRRWGSRWLVTEVPYGEIYATRTLPGFELLVDPRK